MKPPKITPSTIPCDEAQLDAAVEREQRKLRKEMGDANADGVLSAEEVSNELKRHPEGNLAGLLETNALDVLATWKVSQEVIDRQTPPTDDFEMQQSRIAAIRLNEQAARMSIAAQLTTYLDSWKLISSCQVDHVAAVSAEKNKDFTVDNLRNGIYGVRVIDAVAIDVPELYERLKSKLDGEVIQKRVDKTLEELNNPVPPALPKPKRHNEI